MKIIISPAKKMVENIEALQVETLPVFLDKTQKILEFVRTLSYEDAKKIWKCNDQLARLNYQRFENMHLNKNLTPAILAYQGIQYQYMAPEVLELEHITYLQKHLYILSGFYGILRPLDGVTSYRLEMQSKVSIQDNKDLYDFWGNHLYQKVKEDAKIILNLASKEYSKCIERFVGDEVSFVTCIFGERVGNKVIEKGTYAKMARGEMVRFLAEHNVSELSKVKQFNRLGFEYEENISDEKTIVFVRGE